MHVAVENKRGEDSSGKTMSSIKFGLHHHFISTRDVDVLKIGEFARSNPAFKAKIAKLKAISKAQVKRYPPINDEDLNQIDEHLGLSEPKGLQWRACISVAFVACMLQFANRGMEKGYKTIIPSL